MEYVDAYLYESGFIPAQRPHIFPLRFGDAFGDVTQVYPDDSLAEEPGFSGNQLVARGHRWYRDVYGIQLNQQYELGFAPVELGNAIWRFWVPQTYGGKCEYILDRNLENCGVDSDGNPIKKGGMIYSIGSPPKINCLACVDGLQQGMANRLRNEQLNAFLEWCRITITGLSWFVHLFWLVSYDDKRLFYTAFCDYQSSCINLLQGRHSQSRWDSTQAVEKLIKGLLNVVSGKFAKTHELSKLARKLSPYMENTIEESLLDSVYWPTNGRYGEEKTTRAESLKANHGVLEIAYQLAADSKIQERLRNTRDAATLPNTSAPQK
jgi:HEPN domain-containing protein